MRRPAGYRDRLDRAEHVDRLLEHRDVERFRRPQQVLMLRPSSRLCFGLDRPAIGRAGPCVLPSRVSGFLAVGSSKRTSVALSLGSEGLRRGRFLDRCIGDLIKKARYLTEDVGRHFCGGERAERLRLDLAKHSDRPLERRDVGRSR